MHSPNNLVHPSSFSCPSEQDRREREKERDSPWLGSCLHPASERPPKAPSLAWHSAVRIDSRKKIKNTHSGRLGTVYRKCILTSRLEGENQATE